MSLSKARLGRMHYVMAGYIERGDVPGIVTLVSRRGEVHVDAIGTKAAAGGDPILPIQQGVSVDILYDFGESQQFNHWRPPKLRFGQSGAPTLRHPWVGRKEAGAVAHLRSASP